MGDKRLAVYPGMFDPPSLGHLDIIRRGLAVFDEIIVAVAANPDKAPLFTVAERMELLREAAADLAGVRVDSYEGLTVDFVKRVGAGGILRGIRTMSDFDYERHLALTNRTISGVETVFVMGSETYGFISSRLIREVARFGGDVSALVPPCVAKALAKRFS